MSISYVRYCLQDGHIHDWLLAGPQKTSVSDPIYLNSDGAKLQLARRYYEQESGIVKPPVEPGPLNEAKVTIGNFEDTWSHVRCKGDHFVDLSDFYRTPYYLRAWAYTQVDIPRTQDRQIVLTSNGPADVWVNGEHIHRQEHFHQQRPHSVKFDACFIKGRNEVLVRFEEVAIRECSYVMALQIPRVSSESGDEIAVFLPTAITDVRCRNELERIFGNAYLKQGVYQREDRISVHWPENHSEMFGNIAVRIQKPDGRIYLEQRIKTIEEIDDLSYSYELPEGAYYIVLMPDPEEYYIRNVRVKREIGFCCLGNSEYSDELYGTFQERRVEALKRAARVEGSVYAEIAKMAIGWWFRVETDVIMKVIEDVNRRKACSNSDLVGLLGMLYRFGDEPEFPHELRRPLEDCILSFKYWHDEPGDDAMCYTTENHSILFHTCEVLAGQLYPDRVFTNVGETGEWHRLKGERLALGWLHKRGMGGFEEWDSNCCFEEYLVALSHLEEFAERDTLWEMATVVMDKIFFEIAVNSYKGVFGSTHGQTYAPYIKAGLLEATSGISRLMWGMGVFNQHIRGTVSLACMEDYGFPRLIQAIATDLPEEMWDRERHAPYATRDQVNKVTYRAPDYMLCSAQDYHPGGMGDQQHIWQATMGPSAVVFVTHPSCESEKDSHRTNFWCGNRVLPRVAQWKGVLIAVHRLPKGDWMGFTHAYFPAHAFDDSELRDGWAFARKGEGYLALTASQGMEFVKTGDHAYRELRSYGQHNVWLCHMGRAALDGGFEEFQEKILELDLVFEDLSVRCKTLRGETLAFGWEGPLLRNGEEESTTAFKHYENPYCVAELPTEQMDIQFRDQVMRLHMA